VILEITYFLTALLFWAYGFLAYYQNLRGLVRYVGAFFLPILALPVVGRGDIGGHDVRSVLWLAWFALEVALGFGVVLLRLPPTAAPGVPTVTVRSSSMRPVGPAAAPAVSSTRR
jgi:hypothetical protein